MNTVLYCSLTISQLYFSAIKLLNNDNETITEERFRTFFTFCKIMSEPRLQVQRSTQPRIYFCCVAAAQAARFNRCFYVVNF